MNKEDYKAYLRQRLNENIMLGVKSTPLRVNLKTGMLVYDPTSDDKDGEEVPWVKRINAGSKTYDDRMTAGRKRDPYGIHTGFADSTPTDIERAEMDEYENKLRTKEKASRAAEPDKGKEYDKGVWNRMLQA